MTTGSGTAGQRGRGADAGLAEQGLAEPGLAEQGLGEQGLPGRQGAGWGLPGWDLAGRDLAGRDLPGRGLRGRGLPGRGRALLTLAVALPWLAACVPGTPPLDWDLRTRGGTAEAARQATAAPPAADGNGILTYPDYQMAVAREGETVAGLSARLGLDAAAVARANALRPTDALRRGEMVLLPARVAGTPTALATTAAPGAPSGVDVTAIATTALDRVGGQAPAAPAAAAAPPPAAAAAPGAGAPGAGAPIRHRVARGETAFSIARTYNVSARALADWNGLGPDLAVREGQTLMIPVATAPAPQAAASAAVPAVTAPGSGSPTPEPPSARAPLPDETTPPKAAPAAPPVADLGAGRTQASATRLAMPVQGSIIRAYQKGRNEGIDIAAPAGTPVRAAADGTVAAVTKDTAQTPIVVLRHADNLLTVYAGVDALKVAKGDRVTRGQAFAVVRNSSPAFLHFEVRRGVESLDPADFLN